MPPRPHSQRPEIVRLLREGMTHLAISARLRVGEPLVAKVARVEGLTRGQRRRPVGHRELILVLAAEKVVPGEIALAVGCSKRLVQMYLLEQRGV